MQLSLLCAALAPLAPGGDWPAYGNDPGGQRYVVEDQITKANVQDLAPAWTFHTGDTIGPDTRAAFECTPVYMDGLLYVVSPFNKVFAVDPDTGKEKWAFDPEIPRKDPQVLEPFACRGVSTWKDPADGHLYIILATHDARLIELDSDNGYPVWPFGDDGTVNLRQGVGDHYLRNYNETSAPCVCGNLIVVGSSIGDNRALDMPSGVVRAYDAHNGHLRWSWDPLSTLPPVTTALDDLSKRHLARFGGRLRTGAGNAWTTLSCDPARDMVFVPTGSPSPDYCGIFRPGNDADANSIVALRASTGKKLWSYQVVHHDLWDYDVASQPILTDIAGKPAVIVMTKMGFVFVLDRLTGKPLLPVEEHPVPIDGVPGEPVSKTQPFPVWPKPLVPTTFEPWGQTEEDRRKVVANVASLKNEGIYTPPSLAGSVLCPGNIGGCNWSGGSVDPTTNTLFVNTNNITAVLFLLSNTDLDKAQAAHPGIEFNYQLGTPYCIARSMIFDGNSGFKNKGNWTPGSKPPWGQLHAVDLSTGQVRWQVPLGFQPTVADVPGAREWGSVNLGGSFVTSTGLVFIAASMDGNLRAFDSSSGKVLWESLLPAGGQAAPMSFRSKKTGRQYIVQCAGGHHNLGTKTGDSVVAYALPRG